MITFLVLSLGLRVHFFCDEARDIVCYDLTLFDIFNVAKIRIFSCGDGRYIKMNRREVRKIDLTGSAELLPHTSRGSGVLNLSGQKANGVFKPNILAPLILLRFYNKLIKRGSRV